MADKDAKLPDSAPGKFYVDDTCIERFIHAVEHVVADNR